MSYHYLAGPDDAHAIHSWVYATAADRDLHNPSEGSSESITAEDVSLRRICYVVSEHAFYFLKELGPPVVWESFASSGLFAHAIRHETGGADEIDVTDLEGLLADPQTPLGHHTIHEFGGSDEIDVAGLSGVLADDQPPQSHTLDGSKHSGTLPESSMVFAGTGHAHSGGADGKQVSFNSLSDVASLVGIEQLMYTDTTNKVIGELELPPSPGRVALFPLSGTAQEIGKDFTVRQVVGGTAPGWYVCIDPLSTPPGGGAFSGGSNPTTGISGVLSLGDIVQLIYSTYPPP